MNISQGAAATKSGQALENDVSSILDALGISFKSQVKFKDCYNNMRSKMDFYIESLDCAVECKRQNVSGTADQKLPFVLENLQKFPAKRGLIILDGDHYQNRKGIQEYLNSKVSDNFDWCFVDNFGDWLLEQTESRQET